MRDLHFECKPEDGPKRVCRTSPLAANLTPHRQAEDDTAIQGGVKKGRQCASPRHPTQMGKSWRCKKHTPKKQNQEAKKKKKKPSCHFTFISFSILFIHMMFFLKNRKGTKGKNRDLRGEGSVFRWTSGTTSGADRSVETKQRSARDKFSTAPSSNVPPGAANRKGPPALKSQVHMCVQPDQGTRGPEGSRIRGKTRH